VEVNGAFTFSDDDGDGEFYINMGTLAGNSLSFNSVESSIYYFDLGGPNGFSADANSVSLSTNSGTDFITLNSGSYVQILSDSLLIENVPTTTALKNITGFNSNQTLKKIVGAADGHVLVWDNSNSQWESQPNLAGGLSLGSSNQVLGVNNAGTGYEYKTIQGTTNQIDITHGAGTVTLSTPQDIHTAANPTFNDLTLTDVCEAFTNFLQACGFFIDGKTVAIVDDPEKIQDDRDFIIPEGQIMNEPTNPIDDLLN